MKTFLSPNHSQRSDPIDLVVMHSSVSTFQSALDWLRNPASRVSSHYLVSPAGEVIRLVEEAEMAWHAGVSFWRGRSNLNRWSIGIELANRTGAKGFVGIDQYPAVQLQAAVELVQDI